MKLPVDMNLSPAWIRVLEAAGWGAIHWSAAGAATATDAHIMSWARTHDCMVFTNDLDFSAILAATRAEGPSCGTDPRPGCVTARNRTDATGFRSLPTPTGFVLERS